MTTTENLCYSAGTFKDLGVAGACLIAPVDRFVYTTLAVIYEIFDSDTLCVTFLAMALFIPLICGNTKGDKAGVMRSSVFSLFFSDLAIHLSFISIMCGALGLTGAKYPCVCMKSLLDNADKSIAREVFAKNFLIDPVLTSLMFLGCAFCAYINIPVGLMLIICSIPMSFCVGASSILSAGLALCVDAVVFLEYFFAPFGVRIAIGIVSVIIIICVWVIELGEDTRPTLYWITKIFVLHVMSFVISFLTIPRASFGDLLRADIKKYSEVLTVKQIFRNSLALKSGTGVRNSGRAVPNNGIGVSRGNSLVNERIQPGTSHKLMVDANISDRLDEGNSSSPQGEKLETNNTARGSNTSNISNNEDGSRGSVSALVNIHEDSNDTVPTTPKVCGVLGVYEWTGFNKIGFNSYRTTRSKWFSSSVVVAFVIAVVLCGGIRQSV